VPVEEYLFFLLQPVLTGLWVLLLLHADPLPAATGRGARWVGASAYLAAALLGVAALGWTAGTYLGLILAWAAPVLAAQWGYAGEALWARRRVWLLGTGAPTLYLWAADAAAIRDGIWRISGAHTLGPSLAGLPLEEALFFLVTNLLVVQGLLLFLHGARAAEAAPRAGAVAA
jgi:lycopene cyclase domain-containing protein